MYAEQMEIVKFNNKKQVSLQLIISQLVLLLLNILAENHSRNVEEQ
jgi:hypothetical protein